MIPQQEYQRGMPPDPREQYSPQNQNRMSPKQPYPYENGNTEYDPRMNYRRSPTSPPYYNNMRNSPCNGNNNTDFE